MRVYNNRIKHLTFLLGIVCIMTIAFAVLSSSVTINGTSNITGNTWNVKLQNIVVDPNNTVTGTQTITGDTSLTFSVELTRPGDVYSFDVDVVNTGTIDAMLYSLSKTTLTSEQENYLEYTVTYSDGIDINQYDKLVKTNGSDTITVTLKFNDSYLTGDLPTSGLSLSLTLNYVQDDGSGVLVGHTLDNFITLAESGINISDSYVGKEFSVNLGDTYGTHILRVANMSTPSECSGSDFSSTACGVVLEFADIITNHNMNSTNINTGGWTSSSMRTFLNTDIYNALPSDLKNLIIDTKVVSGHGSTTGETNFVTTDKLYLLSSHEIYSNGALYNSVNYDTSHNNTRELDYYSEHNVSTTSYSDAIKKYSGSNAYWWLRSASSGGNTTFLIVASNGNWNRYNAGEVYGVSPAFRIA